MPERVDEAITWSAIDEASTLPADGLREARPPVDRVDMEAVRERTEKSLFGRAAPARFGRYVLLGDSADGGMGIVYAAYDPELHRKVALKVLHPRRQADARGHERLIAEARALAKLDHPNVVKVHDVLMHGEQVVVVMAWVEGKTLATWERERRRSWQEIVAIYVQAGQGLAAAHGVGVIHRDFKPSNAIVGDDGRVRVLDFGLARPALPGGPEPAGEDSPLAQGTAPFDRLTPGPEVWRASFTAAGVMVGTLAYASPEQLEGEVVTPASDQFSFAVSLHRALEGVAPFDGRDRKERASRIRSGRIAIAGDGRAVPAWLRAIVSRGLAAEPSARFASMTALLAELERPRGWRRRRIPLLVGGCVALAALALVIRPGTSDPLAGCDAGRDEVRAVWSDAARVAVEARLGAALTTPDAVGIRRRVLDGLDGYRDHWVSQHRDACVAFRNGEQSDRLLDLRMLCLQKRLDDLRATVGMLEQLDASSAGKAVDIVARMPSVAECEDLDRLQAETAPPPDEQRAAVAVVRAQISRAMALERAGQSRSALATATAAVDAAGRSGYAPVVADAALAQGRILQGRRDVEPAPALVALDRASSVAFEHGMLAVGIEAAARSIYLRGGSDASLAALRREIDVLVPLSKRLPGEPFAEPLLLNNIGTVYMAAGDRAEATRWFQQAHRALEPVGQPDLELTCVDMNLAMVTRDDAARERLARRVWQRYREELGDSHVDTLTALDTYARYTVDPAEALPLLAQACTGFARHHPERIAQRVRCESYRAFLTGELGDHAEELRLYDRIVALGPGAAGDDRTLRVALAAGHAKLLRGDPKAAIATLREVAAGHGASASWWERARAAHAELGLGLAEQALGHRAEAARHLETAIAAYQAAIAMNEQTEYRRRLAIAQRALAALR